MVVPIARSGKLVLDGDGGTLNCILVLAHLLRVSFYATPEQATDVHV